MPIAMQPAPAHSPEGILLLSIGDELLDGRTANTNALWFGEQLRLAGLPVAEIRCVSDRIEDIVAVLDYGRRFPLTLATGGLGPTNDDRTLAAAAEAFQRPLGQTEESFQHVKARYEGRGLPLTEPRLRLALIPRGSEVLPNPTGTAPGVWLTEGAARFCFLPGPPVECRPMFTEQVLPRARAAITGRKLRRREFWRTFGRGESDVYQRVKPLVERLEKKFPDTFTFGVHISFPNVDLTYELWENGAAAQPTEAEVRADVEEITASLGALCFTREREELVHVVARELTRRGLTVATAESCTGGLLAKLFTDLPGSSAYFQGGVVTYANEAKQELLGVQLATLRDHGAVSAPAAAQMAEGIRARLKADHALSLSGVAGPGGGSAEKPVGTIHVALSNASGTKNLHQVILGGKGSRDQNRTIAVHLALDALRTELLVSEGPQNS